MKYSNLARFCFMILRIMKSYPKFLYVLSFHTNLNPNEIDNLVLQACTYWRKEQDTEEPSKSFTREVCTFTSDVIKTLQRYETESYDLLWRVANEMNMAVYELRSAKNKLLKEILIPPPLVTGS